LAKAQDFSPVDRAEALCHPALDPVMDDQGFLRTSPSKHGLEAFFGAVLQRRPR